MASVLMIGALGLTAPAVALAGPPAGTISTVAGNPAASGLATSIGQAPGAVAVGPNGSLYISDETSNTVREIDSAGVESTVAGNGTPGYSGDGGPATGAELDNPEGTAIDAGGDLLIADTYNQRVRLVAGSTCSTQCPYGLPSMTAGDIYTVAGGGSAHPPDVGPATKAAIWAGSVTVDAGGDLLIADTTANRVVLVAGSSCSSDCPYGLASMIEGYIYTVAGSANRDLGDGGPATTAVLAQPGDVAVDAGGDLLIADTGNNRVRLVAGSTCSTDCPYGLGSMTKGYIYTIAGDLNHGYSGDGGPATGAELENPTGVAVDGGGNLLIADTGNKRVRLVAASSCSTACPYGLTSMTAGDIYTVAGNGTAGYSGDGGPATSAEFADEGIAAGGNLLIADQGNHRLRLVAATSCSTACPYGLASMTKGDIYTIAGNGTPGYSGDGGPATNAELAGPTNLAVDSGGDLLIADTSDSRVRLVAGASCASSCPYDLTSMTKGDIYTVAGDGGFGFAGDGGPASSAELQSPEGVAVDAAGNLLIADTQNQLVRMVAGSSCASSCAYGLSSMTKGDIYRIAGNAVRGYRGDSGPATSAELSDPASVAVDGAGDLLIADTRNELVRLVAGSSCASDCPYGLTSMTKGDIYAIAGGAGFGFAGDGGPATSAALDNPESIAVDTGGDLLIADEGNDRVRLVAGSSCSTACPYGLTAMTKGYIYTIAGWGLSGGSSGDGGPGTNAELDDPTSVAVDAGGDVLIADQANDRVQLVAGSSCSTGCPYGLTSTIEGDIYTVAGTGTAGYSGDGGPAAGAQLDSPEGVAIDGSDDLLIADTGNNRVREVAAGTASPSASPAGPGSSTVTGNVGGCKATCTTTAAEASVVTTTVAPAAGSSHRRRVRRRLRRKRQVRGHRQRRHHGHRNVRPQRRRRRE
jgi:hypothetical protein